MLSLSLTLYEESYSDSTLIVQLFRDNLTLRTLDVQEIYSISCFGCVFLVRARSLKEPPFVWVTTENKSEAPKDGAEAEAGGDEALTSFYACYVLLFLARYHSSCLAIFFL